MPDTLTETTFGQLIAVLCRKAAAEHRKRGESLTWEEVGEIVDMAYHGQSSEADDDEWLATLALSPKYEGIDLQAELATCKAFTRRTPGRKQFLNWLAKAERPLAPNGRKLKRLALPEPPGWRERLTDNNPDCIYAPGGMQGEAKWEELMTPDQQSIIQALTKIL